MDGGVDGEFIKPLRLIESAVRVEWKFAHRNGALHCKQRRTDGTAWHVWWHSHRGRRFSDSDRYSHDHHRIQF